MILCTPVNIALGFVWPRYSGSQWSIVLHRTIGDTTCRVTVPKLYCQARLLRLEQRPQLARWPRPCESATAEMVPLGVRHHFHSGSGVPSHSFALLGNEWQTW